MAITITNPGIRMYHLPAIKPPDSFTPAQVREYAKMNRTLMPNDGRLEVPDWYVEQLLQERGWKRRLEPSGRNSFTVKSTGGGTAAQAFEARIRQHRSQLQDAQAEARDARAEAEAATRRVAELEAKGGASDDAAKRIADLETQLKSEREAKEAATKRAAELELLNKAPPSTDSRDTEVAPPKGGGKRA